MIQCQSWSWFKLLDFLIVFLKEFFEKVDFEKMSAGANKSIRITQYIVFCLPKVLKCYDLNNTHHFFFSLLSFDHLNPSAFNEAENLTLCQLMPSADNLLKHFVPRSVLTKCVTKCQAWSGSKLFDTLMVFLKEFFRRFEFEKKSADDKYSWKHSKYAKS